MKQVTSKTPEKDIKNVLGSGFEVVAEMVDEKMLRLRVYNVETGDHFTITKMGDYSSDIRCLVKEPPKMETVARLYGTMVRLVAYSTSRISVLDMMRSQ